MLLRRLLSLAQLAALPVSAAASDAVSPPAADAPASFVEQVAADLESSDFVFRGVVVSKEPFLGRGPIRAGVEFERVKVEALDVFRGRLEGKHVELTINTDGGFAHRHPTLQPGDEVLLGTRVAPDVELGTMVALGPNALAFLRRAEDGSLSVTTDAHDQRVRHASTLPPGSRHATDSQPVTWEDAIAAFRAAGPRAGRDPVVLEGAD